MSTPELWEPLQDAFTGDLVRKPTGLWTRTDGKGILYPGGTNILYGESESGKTLGALAAAKEVCDAGGLVFFFDFEMSAETIVMRLRQLGADVSITENFFYVMHPELGGRNQGYPLLQKFREDIIAKAAEVPEGTEVMVLIDSYDEFLGGMGIHPNDQEAGTEMRAHMSAPLNAEGITVVIIDHASTSEAGKAKKGSAGSFRKMANVDLSIKFHVVSQPAPGRLATVQLYVDKDRFGSLRAETPAMSSGDKKLPYGQMLVDSQDNPEEINISVRPGGASTRQKKELVMDYLKLHGAFSPEKAIHPKAIQQAWEEEHMRSLEDDSVPTEEKPSSRAAETAVRALAKDEDSGVVWYGTLGVYLKE